MPILLKDLVAVALPSQAAKRSLQSPSSRRTSANQNLASSVSPIADLSTPQRSAKRSVSEEEQAKMDAFVFFSMMR
ncbi:hypothetical protein JG688_00001218 [Phytophthora aleatoria]|uniref:Uncharacterized protein n=1 Tax=Phytophthora aleatoria TaxID=2496075 RepID=A0A8J5IW53_9STRA|nr:hypothetical protein JG688_00001218 [Phytophthora aleatoria]